MGKSEGTSSMIMVVTIVEGMGELMEANLESWYFQCWKLTKTSHFKEKPALFKHMSSFVLNHFFDHGNGRCKLQRTNPKMGRNYVYRNNSNGVFEDSILATYFPA